MNDRQEALHVAGEALGLNRDYYVQVVVTARVRRDLDDVTAPTLEVAIALAKEQLNDINYGWDDEVDVEGDQQVYVRDIEGLEEALIDARDEGEPFSWKACEIVKKLAITDAGDHAAVAALVARAIDACTVERGKVEILNELKEEDEAAIK